MDRRSEFSDILCEIINIKDPVDGDDHIYFQPPASVRMKYPAIRYELKGYDKVYADDGAYRLLPSYEVTLIDKNPESEYVMKILNLPYCQFDRAYPADNLNHFVFTIYHN